MMHTALLMLVLQVDEAQEALKKAIKSAGDMTSYGYTKSTKTDGSHAMEMEAERTEGKYQKDVALTLKEGRVEAVKIKGKTAYRVGDGDWKKLTQKSWNVSFSFDEGDMPDETDMAIMRLQGMTAPHEHLKARKGQLKDVKVQDDTEKVGEDECVVFTCEFEYKGGGWGSFFFGGGGKKKDDEKKKDDNPPQPKQKNKGKFWIDDAYNIRRVVFESFYSYEMMGENYETTTTETFEFTKIGETTVEVPEEAKKAMERKDE